MIAMVKVAALAVAFFLLGCNASADGDAVFTLFDDGFVSDNDVIGNSDYHATVREDLKDLRTQYAARIRLVDAILKTDEPEKADASMRRQKRAAWPHGKPEGGNEMITVDVTR